MPGLKFYKLDLHIHTPASKCYSYPEHIPKTIVQSAIDCGLTAIAITDHNTAEWIDATKEAAQGTSLVIFPGIEISLSEGFHLVGLFDPSVNQKHVESFLGAIDREDVRQAVIKHLEGGPIPYKLRSQKYNMP